MRRRARHEIGLGAPATIGDHEKWPMGSLPPSKLPTGPVPPQPVTKTITIEVKGNNKKEANETFYLGLFGDSSNLQFSKSRGIGAIRSDDGPCRKAADGALPAKQAPHRPGTGSKSGLVQRLVPNRADSFQKRPTQVIRTVCGYPSGTSQPRFSSRFEARSARWGGLPC